MLKAVIFDFDGTILDTETPEFMAWQQIYREHGSSLEPLDWVHCIGTAAIFDPHLLLEERSGGSLDRDRVQVRRRTLLDPLLEAELLRPGVLEVLDSARGRGLKTAIASSSSRDWLERWLAKFELRNSFASLHGREDVEEVKPNPALYLRALEALEVEAHEAIALEDSLHGLRAAKAAGITTVVVPNAMTCHLDLSEADLVLESWLDLDLGRF